MSASSPLAREGENQWPDTGSVWRRRLQQTYDAAVWALARRHTRAAFSVLDAGGRLACRARLHGPSPAEVAALFVGLAPGRQRSVARTIAALRLKNRAVVALVQRGGIDRLADLARWPSDPAGRELFDGRGRIVIACHVGAFFGIRAAFHRLGRSPFMLRDAPMHDTAVRSAALKRAVDAVRGGEVVVATIDGPGGSSTGEVACLGRRVVFRRGPFVLARLTGAPLVPVTSAWTPDACLALRIGPPIDVPGDGDPRRDDFETTMAQRTARWLEGYLLAEPEEIWLSTLRNFLAAPRI